MSASADTEDEPSAGTQRRKELLLLLLVGLWLFVGLFGHDPWKSEEAANFGLAHRALESGDWVVPNLAGEAWVKEPPLLVVTAAAAMRAFSWLLPAHDAARLATALFVALTLLFLGATAQRLYGRPLRWVAVLVFIGCLGLWDRAHQLIPENALLAGWAIALYGLSRIDSAPTRGGLWLGSGTGVAFLATGLTGPVSIGLTALLLLLFPRWRRRSFAVASAWAVLAALPWLVLWPAALHARSPELFDVWLWVENVGRAFATAPNGSEDAPLFYLRNLPWIAWPAWPLALWTLRLRMRGFNGGMGVPGIEVPTVATGVLLALLAGSTDNRAAHALPVLLPLALLACAEIESLARGRSALLDWFGILTFGLGAIVLWILWLQTVFTGMAPAIARLLNDAQRGYVAPVSVPAVILSVLLTVAWVAMVRPARRSNRRAVLNWAVGVTLVWALTMTLWLPYQDARKSYRSVAQSLQRVLPPDIRCVASRNLGDAQRALFDYFAGLATVREEVRPDHDCPLMLVQGREGEPDGLDDGWRLVWQGARPGDGVERYRLYAQTPDPAAP